VVSLRRTPVLAAWILDGTTWKTIYPSCVIGAKEQYSSWSGPDDPALVASR
jgi:hypothetical protein